MKRANVVDILKNYKGLDYLSQVGLPPPPRSPGKYYYYCTWGVSQNQIFQVIYFKWHPLKWIGFQGQLQVLKRARPWIGFEGDIFHRASPGIRFQGELFQGPVFSLVLQNDDRLEHYNATYGSGFLPVLECKLLRSCGQRWQYVWQDLSQ